MQRHTPGPWTATQTSPNALGVYMASIRSRGDGNTCAIAYSAYYLGDKGREECKANADLIAAAPNMLAMLLAIRDADDDVKGELFACIPTPRRNALDAVIKLALDGR